MRWRSATIAALLAATAGCAQLPGIGGSPVATALPIETFGPSRGRGVETVVMIVDAGGAERDRWNAFARAAADAVPDGAAVTILAADADGTAPQALSIERARAIGSTVATVRDRYPEARIVLFGASTGAALAADVAGTHRDLIDALVLVSCPCSLPEWRTLNPRPDRDGAAPDLDPLLIAGGIDPDVRAAVLVGAEDRTTPPRFSRAFAEALALRGIATDFQVIPGRGHDIFDAPETLDALRRVAGGTTGATATAATS